MQEHAEAEVAQYKAALDRMESKLDAIADGLKEIRGVIAVPVGDLSPADTPTALGLLHPTASGGSGDGGKPSPYDLLPGRVGIELTRGSGVTACEVVGVLPDGNFIQTTYPVASDALRVLVDVRLPAGTYWLPKEFRLDAALRWTAWEEFPEWVRDRIRKDLG